MLDQLAEAIRSQVYAALQSGGIPVDQSFVAPGSRWAREGCRQLVVEYVTTRRSNLGEGPTPAQQGVGFSGQCASVRHHDMRVTFVDGCYPVSEIDEPTDAKAVQAWTLPFLQAVDLIDLTLGAMTFPGMVSGLTVGNTEPFGPDGGVARVTWPVSITEL
jgi:hypothetical protein